MKRGCDVAVIGAGVVGMATAKALVLLAHSESALTIGDHSRSSSLARAPRPLAEMLALHGMRHERHFRVHAVLFYCCYTTPGQDSCSRKGRSGREARVGPAAATKRKGHLESST